MKERLRKIYELSLHGTDGEKANAQELLKNLLSKHRLSIADIADEAKAERRFKPKNKTEVRLLCQIVNKVTDGDNRAIWSYRGSKDRVVELTTAEFIEVELLFSEYIAALKKEQDRSPAHQRDSFRPSGGFTRFCYSPPLSHARKGLNLKTFFGENYEH